MLCVPSNITNSLFFPFDIYVNLVGFHTLVPVIHIHVVIPSRKCFFVQTWQLSSTVTLKIRSMLPKSNKLLLNNNPIFTLKIRSWARLKIPGCLKSCIWYVHLKIRSRSPKANQFFIVSQYYIHANLIKICQPVHEICRQASFFVLNSTVEVLEWPWKISSRSPKPIRLFIMSQCCTIYMQIWLKSANRCAR